MIAIQTAVYPAPMFGVQSIRQANKIYHNFHKNGSLRESCGEQNYFTVGTIFLKGQGYLSVNHKFSACLKVGQCVKYKLYG